MVNGQNEFRSRSALHQDGAWERAFFGLKRQFQLRLGFDLPSRFALTLNHLKFDRFVVFTNRGTASVARMRTLNAGCLC